MFKGLFYILKWVIDLLLIGDCVVARLGDGGDHVRDGGPGRTEEREARGADPAGGGQEGSQARHAGPPPRPVRTANRYRASQV